MKTGMYPLLLGGLLLLCPALRAEAANLAEAEYFVDVDPGYGDGTAVTLTAGTTATQQFTVPTAGLSPGMHTLYGSHERQRLHLGEFRVHVTRMRASEARVQWRKCG